MKYLFKIQEKIVPELISLAEIRYTILRTVNYYQPIGRRNLARKLNISERSARNELEFLQSRGFITVGRAGTNITEAGLIFLDELDIYIKEIKDIKNLEERLKDVLALNEVLVVPGELKYSSVNREISRFTASYLRDILRSGDILAITGGSTLAQVAESMRYMSKVKDIMVIPGRGGIGEQVEIQANTIAAKIAKKLGGRYRLLHVPDNLKKENLEMIIAEPSIQKTLTYLQKTDILIHGIGGAREMAERRGMKKASINKILRDGAIGEAFGIYFNQEGEIVYSTACVGLSLQDVKKINKVVVVAGGVNKARAIIAAVSPDYQDTLITDELTAREIIKLKGGD